MPYFIVFWGGITPEGIFDPTTVKHRVSLNVGSSKEAMIYCYDVADPYMTAYDVGQTNSIIRVQLKYQIALEKGMKKHREYVLARALRDHRKMILVYRREGKYFESKDEMKKERDAFNRILNETKGTKDDVRVLDRSLEYEVRGILISRERRRNEREQSGDS